MHSLLRLRRRRLQIHRHSNLIDTHLLNPISTRSKKRRRRKHHTKYILIQNADEHHHLARHTQVVVDWNETFVWHISCARFSCTYKSVHYSFIILVSFQLFCFYSIAEKLFLRCHSALLRGLRNLSSSSKFRFSNNCFSFIYLMHSLYAHTKKKPHHCASAQKMHRNAEPLIIGNLVWLINTESQPHSFVIHHLWRRKNSAHSVHSAHSLFSSPTAVVLVSGSHCSLLRDCVGCRLPLRYGDIKMIYIGHKNVCAYSAPSAKYTQIKNSSVPRETENSFFSSESSTKYRIFIRQRQGTGMNSFAISLDLSLCLNLEDATKHRMKIQ